MIHNNANHGFSLVDVTKNQQQDRDKDKDRDNIHDVMNFSVAEM